MEMGHFSGILYEMRESILELILTKYGLAR